MHLALRAPNIWFRARLRYPDARAPGGRVDVNGFTLPGMPAVVVGSNGHVAWGFTNSYSDWLGLGAAARRAPTRAASTARACRCSASRAHRRRGRRRRSTSTSRKRAWGPVLARRGRQRARAALVGAPAGLAATSACWTWRARAILDDALRRRRPRRASRRRTCSSPIAAAASRWRLLGPLPQRAAGCDAPMPDAATMRAVRRCAPLADRAPARRALLDPPAAACGPRTRASSTATRWRSVGDGGYALGARAQQIRDDLFAQARSSTNATCSRSSSTTARCSCSAGGSCCATQAQRATTRRRCTQLAEAPRTWEGRASADSVSYRIVRAWRLAVHDRIADGLTAPAQAALGEDFVMPDLPQFEGVAWPLVTQRPMHLLPRALRDVGRAVRRRRAGSPRRPRSSKARWPNAPGAKRNTARICHPLARALPFAQARCCACRPTAARRRHHAARAIARQRRVRTHGRVAGPRSRRHLPHARRTERPSAVAVLGRGTRRLGAGTADAVPAGTDGTHADASYLSRTEAAHAATAPSASVSLPYRTAWKWMHMRLLGLLILALLSAAIAIYAVAVYSLLPLGSRPARRR